MALDVVQQHALTQFIAWGILIDIGIILLRYTKKGSSILSSQFFHTLILTITFVMSCYAISLMLPKTILAWTTTKGVDSFNILRRNIHIANGLLIGIVSFLTVISGFIAWRSISKYDATH